MSKILTEQGLLLDPEPEVEVTPSMLITTEKVLRRKIEINPYKEWFIEPNEENSEELDKLNHFLNLAMPFPIPEQLVFTLNHSHFFCIFNKLC